VRRSVIIEADAWLIEHPCPVNGDPEVKIDLVAAHRVPHRHSDVGVLQRALVPGLAVVVQDQLAKDRFEHRVAPR